jgi:hypothetical protein
MAFRARLQAPRHAGSRPRAREFNLLVLKFALLKSSRPIALTGSHDYPFARPPTRGPATITLSGRP